MSWYDVFSNFYDASLEPLYREHRLLAAEALRLGRGASVLDVPCGTGQSFGAIARAVGETGIVLGVDASAGMLRAAKARCAREGLERVRMLEADAATLNAEAAAAAVGGPRHHQRAPGAPESEALAAQPALRFDRLHVFLGMSVFPDHERCFEQLWGLLAPGGQCVLVDVYAERLGLQGWFVNQLANAEIRRKFWEPLERVGAAFALVDLPFRSQHGGQIKLAQARKPEPA